MQVPLQITFDDIAPSPAVEARVRREVAKLEKVYSRLTSARVVIGKPQDRHVKGDRFRVQIHLEVPGGPELVISRDPGVGPAHRDVYVTVRDAFAAARRQLLDLSRRRSEH